MATTTASSPPRFATNGSRRPGERDAGGPGGEVVEGNPSRKSLFKSKKFLIAVVALLAVGGGAYKFLAPQAAGPPQPGEVVPLDATTLNLQGGHYLKIAIAVQLVQGKASATDFSTSKAAEATINEFSNRTVASLSSNAARKHLLAELLLQLKQDYPGEVYDVFVTEYITQ